jgi:hypothetical protein
MASTIIGRCECGLPYQVYFPKASLYKWGLMGKIYRLKDWQEIDESEVKAGESNAAKKVAEALGFPFVDSREAKKYLCPGCQREGRISEVLKEMKDLLVGRQKP